MREVTRQRDRENFIRLANKRVNKTIKCLDLIGNLSNRANYCYTESDVKKIFTALQCSIDECKGRFAEKQRQKTVFNLGDGK